MCLSINGSVRRFFVITGLLLTAAASGCGIWPEEHYATGDSTVYEPVMKAPDAPMPPAATCYDLVFEKNASSKGASAQGYYWFDANTSHTQFAAGSFSLLNPTGTGQYCNVTIPAPDGHLASLSIPRMAANFRHTTAQSGKLITIIDYNIDLPQEPRVESLQIVVFADQLAPNDTCAGERTRLAFNGLAITARTCSIRSANGSSTTPAVTQFTINEVNGGCLLQQRTGNGSPAIYTQAAAEVEADSAGADWSFQSTQLASDDLVECSAQ